MTLSANFPFLRATKWNASLILTCGFQELGSLRKVIMLENPHFCKDTKMAPPLDFCTGMSRPVNWYRDYVINACDTWYDVNMWAGKVNFRLSFHVLSISALEFDFIPHLFPPISNIFDRTELSVGTETINQTRPWVALALLIYSSSRDRLTAGQIALSLSSQILFGIGEKRTIKSVPKPRNGKLCKYCLLYSSGEILESIARSLFTLTVNEDTTANVYLYLCWV